MVQIKLFDRNRFGPLTIRGFDRAKIFAAAAHDAGQDNGLLSTKASQRRELARRVGALTTTIASSRQQSPNV
jgi:hypothetical protein